MSIVLDPGTLLEATLPTALFALIDEFKSTIGSSCVDRVTWRRSTLTAQRRVIQCVGLREPHVEPARASVPLTCNI